MYALWALHCSATFHRLMQHSSGSLVDDSILIFLDDVVVFSPDFNSQLRHLEEVFQRLHECVLKPQPKKCSLFQHQVTYLCHIISTRAVATDSETSEIILGVRWLLLSFYP